MRAQLERLLAVSPDGRTIPELRAFLVTQRPASRDTIARVLHQLVAEHLVVATDEPKWRRVARAAAFDHARPVRRRQGARGLRGRACPVRPDRRAAGAGAVVVPDDARRGAVVPFPCGV
ncbi:hypothetical protein [Gemmatimonas sp.]